MPQKPNETCHCMCEVCKQQKDALMAENAELKRRLEIKESEEKEKYKKVRQNFQEAMQKKQG